jgi:hypothetical protein
MESIEQSPTLIENKQNGIALRVVTTPHETAFGVFLTVDNLKTSAEVDAYNAAIQEVLTKANLPPRHNVALTEDHQPGKHYWEIPNGQLGGKTEAEIAQLVGHLLGVIHTEAIQKYPPGISA